MFRGLNLSERKLIKGFFSAKTGKVYVKDEDAVKFLVEKGYGEKIENVVELQPYEVLYLAYEGLLEVYDEETGKRINEKELLKIFSQQDRLTWSKYLVYRDLRKRGYVVKSGFGYGVDFRVYERGEYNKKAAKYLVCGIFEGEPIQIKTLMSILAGASNVKKEVILGVIERKGEVVYYSLSSFTP
ncbi:tRNA-intron lyase [Candidatus Bathyarchaeota archaeon]|nr:MAG: tRNA-intron lyase [Candidatus Bathyarchaeota archaeon]